MSMPLKHLRNLWKTLEMPLITCEINLILTWSSTFIIADTTGVGTFAITDTKVIVILSTQDNAKLLQKLKSGFKRTLNWTKYQSKVSIEGQSNFVDYFFNPSFQGEKRLFVLSFEKKMVEQHIQDIIFQM